MVITGGSRGLGLELAREFGRQGAKLARGLDAVTERGDVRQRDEVDGAIDRIARRCGRIDVLVNNAGIIQDGPFDQMTVEEFENAQRGHLFGPLMATLAVRPHLRRAGDGRIVNIVSMGGSCSAGLVEFRHRRSAPRAPSSGLSAP